MFSCALPCIGTARCDMIHTRTATTGVAVLAEVGVKEIAWTDSSVYLSAIVEGATLIRALRANSPPTSDRCWEST